MPVSPLGPGPELPIDANGNVIRSFKRGVLRVRPAVAIGVGATALNATPNPDTTAMIVYAVGAAVEICDKDGNALFSIAAGSKEIIDAIGEAQSTFFAKAAAPTTVNISELG